MHSRNERYYASPINETRAPNHTLVTLTSLPHNQKQLCSSMGYMSIVVFAFLMAKTFSYSAPPDSVIYTIRLQGDPDVILTAERTTNIAQVAARFGCVKPQVHQLPGQKRVWQEYRAFFVQLTCGSGEITVPEYKQALEAGNVPVSSIVVSVGDERDPTDPNQLLFFLTVGSTYP